MDNPSPTLVKDIRSKLEDAERRIRTELDYKNDLVSQLKDAGFDFFCGKPNTEIEPEHVVKIFLLLTVDALIKKESAVSPLCFAEYCNNETDAENLIKNQFKTKWATTSGLPQPFTYYEFCNKQGTTDLLKYNPRRENVFVQVYTKCLSMAQLPKYEIRQLCPKVYLKASSNTWKEWNAENNEIRDADMTSLEWMQEPIRRFVLENADNLPTDTGRALETYLKKPTIYWAVIEDTDFENGDRLNLNDIGRTQVYVGKSVNGIRNRWLNDSTSHTRMIKKCLDNANAMTTYDPQMLQGIQLVQARLALAKLRNERCAVFLMKMFDYDLRTAKKLLRRLKIVQSSKESEANKKLLDKAEEQHINGKRFLNDENIIPENEVNNLVWKPKDMAFGMNSK